VLNAILKTFRGLLDPSGFFPLRIFGGGGSWFWFFVMCFVSLFLVYPILLFFFIVPSVFSNVYSTIVNGVAEERYFRVSSLSVPGEGYSRNA
jgi:hypothetical protein